MDHSQEGFRTGLVLVSLDFEPIQPVRVAAMLVRKEKGKNAAREPSCYDTLVSLRTVTPPEDKEKFLSFASSNP
jgi:hypothetical protein